MFVIKLLILFTLINTGGFSSGQVNDSDLSKLAHITDSSKIEILLEEVWAKRSNDPLSAIKIAKLAKTISEKFNYNSLIAKIDNYLGVIYTNIGANEIALDYHFDALARSREASDQIQEAYSYNNIGGIYRIKNEFVPASENILSAIDIFEKNNDPLGLAYCYINMGRLYKDQSNLGNSYTYLDKALKISDQINNEDIKARILLEIADILFRKGKYDEAENAYLQLEKLYEKINYLKGLAEVRIGLSELHFKEKKYNDALKFASNALELNKKILNTEGEIINLNNIALIYLALNQVDKASDFLNLSLKKAKDVNEPDLLLYSYKVNYEFYKKRGKLKESLFYYEKYNNLKDSVYTKEELIKFGELESMLRAEKAEKENHILQNNLDRQITQRNYLLIFIVLIVIIVIIITYRFVEKKKLSEELEKTNIVKDKFFSIIAHDLREPYNAIFNAVEILKNEYDELSETERKETIDTIGKLIKSDYDLLENLLIWAHNQSNFIEFKPEKLLIKNILSNILLIFKNNIDKKNITVNVNCDDDMNVFADEQMLNTIFRNLIFNSIKFSKYGGEIYISVEKSNGHAKLTIQDNGVGMSKEILTNLFHKESKNSTSGTAGESGSGLGLILTKDFIERHKGTIEVKSKQNEGTTMSVILPQV